MEIFMKTKTLLAMALIVGAGSGLVAQEPHVGFGISIGFPTGDFRSKTFPPTTDVKSPQNNGYDLGLGGQVTLSFPMDPSFALRLNFKFLAASFRVARFALRARFRSG